MTEAPNVNLEPDYAEIADPAVQRAVQIIVPPGTSPDTATKAVRETVNKWLDTLRDKVYLKLLTNVHIKGPYFCPWKENYGDDMYMATAMFRSEKPTKVPRELVVGNRRLSEKADMTYREFSAPVPALPDDLDEQMENVKRNPEKVRDDLATLAKKADDKEAHDERFG